jgi:hypothetical protein
VATAIVSGALANKPLSGGEAWVRLSWVLGLRRLGFDAYFVEQIEGSSCVDRSGAAAEFADSVNRSHFESVVHDFGLDGRAGLLCDEGCEAAGLSREEIREAAAGADLLVNISGHLTIAEILKGPGTSVYVDLDPGFTQAWHADPAVPFRIAAHDRYVTVGLNVGKEGCPIPTGSLDWIPTLPPVLLEHWMEAPAPPGPPRFTTVATWRSPYGELEIDGHTMTLKHHQFRRLIELPEQVEGASFELALDIHPGDSADLTALRAHGWEIVDPRSVAATPQAFRDYVLTSTAEFSVAQGVYTETGSGWFSDRSAAYLACGRPVLVQDTGLGDALAAERGLVTFASPESATARAGEILRDYAPQATAARAFAEQHLDSDLVLARLLERIGSAKR